MTASKFLAVAAMAALSFVAAHAGDGEAVAPEYTPAFVGNRSRADVDAEAVATAKVISTVPAASLAFVVPPSKLERNAVRAEAAEALRRGQIPRGEANFM